MAEGIRPIRQIREALGESMQIMVEFHGFWNLPCAVEIAHALEPYHVTWLEEMLPQDNMAAYETLARQVKQPLCISERLLTRWVTASFWKGERPRLSCRILPGAVEYQRPGRSPTLRTPCICQSPTITVVDRSRILQTGICHGDAESEDSGNGSAALQRQVFARRDHIGAPQNGRLGVPPGPGLGVELREEFLRSGRWRLTS